MAKVLLRFLLKLFLFALATMLAAIVLKLELGGIIEMGIIYYIAGYINAYFER